MSHKNFCDRCGAEIELPGNDYGASQVTFNRTPGSEDGWRVTWQIRREYQGSNTDLCKLCTLVIIEQATREKLDFERAAVRDAGKEASK